MDKQAPAGLASSGADVFSVQLPNIPSPPPKSRPYLNPASQSQKYELSHFSPPVSSEVVSCHLCLHLALHFFPSSAGEKPHKLESAQIEIKALPKRFLFNTKITHFLLMHVQDSKYYFVQ